MRSGSQLHIITARSFAACTIAPRVDSLATLNDGDDLSWSEDVTLVNSESGFLHIDFPGAEFIHIVQPPKPRRPTAKLLHGRSPLGLAKPILAEDLEKAATRPARVLQLIYEERHAARSFTCRPGSLATVPSKDPTNKTLPRPMRIISQHRAYPTEPPLIQPMMKPLCNLQKFYERRILEIILRILLAQLEQLLQALASVSP